jgi:acid stress-induced BolA-like protein IbaG/YrbA
LTAREIQARIEAAMPGCRAAVEGGDAHFTAVVVAGDFEGRSRIERHQMIYALFRDEMASQAIHALALRTSTPGERERARQPSETEI